jgi:hypothetical protein
MALRLAVGDLIRTSYGDGPYRIVKIEHGCTCTPYLAAINGPSEPEAPHSHIVCVDADVPLGGETEHHCRWLNYYRPIDETSYQASNGDRVELVGHAAGVQMSLFT